MYPAWTEEKEPNVRTSLSVHHIAVGRLGLEQSVYKSNPLVGLLIRENKYSRLAFQIVVRVLSGRVHHINIDFSPGVFECGYGILLCPPIARTDKVELLDIAAVFNYFRFWLSNIWIYSLHFSR